MILHQNLDKIKEAKDEEECIDLCGNDSVCKVCTWNETICTCQVKVEPETTGDAEGCQDVCQKNPDCKFWTWNKKNDQCFIKNITNYELLRAVTNHDVVSGPKYCGMNVF